MKLRLKYKHTSQSTAQAAFIQGENPREWLAVLNTFGMQLSDLECYVVPKSKQDIVAGGMYVVFPLGKKIEEFNLLLPYQKIQDRLFIPIQSELFPIVEKEEWKNILFYDRNFFHPTLGLIGFNYFDAINWKHLISFPELSENKWSFAAKGNEPFPALHKINIILPPEKDIIQTLQEGMEKKPLSDLPKTDKEKENETFFEKIKRKSLEKGLGATDSFRKNFGSDTDYNENVEKMLSKFENWMRGSLENLQQKRNDEINRLIQLFEDDPEEALKYALPLDSKYQSRGQASPSGRLGRRNTSFNIGRLGGGGRSDAWDIGDRYYTLTAKYRRTAEELIKQKKYKKAAYIYANLLADFYAAANVLKQGKHYHEAAALYKVHLNNKAGAAECYEQGGLYLEAIEVYKEIGGKDEKIGDLYQEINQEENARHFYYEAVNTKKNYNNFIKAGKILEEKLGEKEEAKELYFNGWENDIEKEDCLSRYFELSEDNLSKEIKHIYEEHTPIKKQEDFLNVLIDIQEKENKGVQHVSKEIAYEILSRQSQSGNKKNLRKLRHFIQNDSLIASDINRYIVDHKNIVIQPERNIFEIVEEYNLDENKHVKWLQGRLLMNQFVAFGVFGNSLRVSRWDLKKNTQKMALGNKTGATSLHHWNGVLNIINGSPASSVLFYSLGNKRLGSDEFSAGQVHKRGLLIVNPSWFPEGMLGMHVYGNHLVAIVAERSQVFFKNYTLKGRLVSTETCVREDGSSLMIAPTLGLSDMVLRKNTNCFYMARGQYLREFKASARVREINLHGNARKMVISEGYLELRLLIATDNGCWLYAPKKESFYHCGGAFAIGYNIHTMYFFQNYLLIADEFNLFLYTNPKDINELPKLVGQTKSKHAIASVHQGKKRNECMVLTKSGQVISYALGVEVGR